MSSCDAKLRLFALYRNPNRSVYFIIDGKLHHQRDLDVEICRLTLLTISRPAWSFRFEAARQSSKFLGLRSSGEDEDSSLSLGRLPLVATGLIWAVMVLLVWLVWLEGWWKL